MSAKIINLGDYRPAVSCRMTGIGFPQVYRLRGFYWDLASDYELLPGQRKAPFEYSLSDSDPGGLANVTFETAHHLTLGLDSGWLFVRHHMQETMVEGYLDCHRDSEVLSRTTRLVYRAKNGLFTLLHRKPTKGCRDCLVFYITKIPEPLLGGWMDFHTILMPDGSISYDANLLSPPYE